ncbi:transmembrane protein 143-like [Lingula anatina]|uniref:Transmembrane protein 143-like n=1 Tax=Lingula anatina TaxID=7574 RepID=A0A1S3HQ17_LINAN|nr:transmembrane protein 143-like [Lingula anatina]|eukprot:XP_013388132.1 transmembrane protein 143-like [Lingula anatina]
MAVCLARQEVAAHLGQYARRCTLKAQPMVCCSALIGKSNVPSVSSSAKTSSSVIQRRTLFGSSKIPQLSNILSRSGKELQDVEEEDADDYRERFIPVTRLTLHRMLLQEPNFLTDQEKKMYNEFADALDSAVDNKYKGTLRELNAIFDPINPDKDTLVSKQLSKKQRMDQEFYLLQKLAEVLETANFHELPRPVVERALEDKNTAAKVMVSVDPTKYDVLRFWVLGKEFPPPDVSWYQSLLNRLRGLPQPKPVEYYKRVLVAVRHKRDQKVMLKFFKEVPSNSLEKLLPEGKIYMTKFDQGVLLTMGSTAAVGILIKLVTWMASMEINWSLLLTGVTGLIGARVYGLYKDRRNAYLVDLNRMLYFKNIANNRGVLSLLVDRSCDETFKEVLLTYTYLLTTRAPSIREKGSSEHLPSELGGLSAVQLEKKIEDWVQEKTGSKIEFESSVAINFLKSYGIVQETDDKLFVIPLKTATKTLPYSSQHWMDEVEEEIEGYDREGKPETDEQYKKEAKKEKLIGWQ